MLKVTFKIGMLDARLIRDLLNATLDHTASFDVVARKSISLNCSYPCFLRYMNFTQHCITKPSTRVSFIKENEDTFLALYNHYYEKVMAKHAYLPRNLCNFHDFLAPVKALGIPV